MEHSTSAVNWQPVNLAKAPGQLLRNSLGHVARGADAVGFFQWRASAAGGEKYHSALVPHAGTDTKIWREVMELGAVLDRAAEVAGTRVEAQAAVLFDWQAGWAWDQGAHPTSAFTYAEHPVALHRALWRLGVTTDGVRPGQDLSRYRLVVVPTLYLMDDACVAELTRFTQNGGQVLITFCSGLADQNDHVILGGYPGAVRELLGVSSEEIFPLAANSTVRIGAEWSGRLWTELTQLRGAEAIERYIDGPVAGEPAITRNRAGAGAAWYCNTSLDEASATALLHRICTDAGLGTTAAPEGVELVRRSGDGRSYLFAFNHTSSPQTIAASGYDLVRQADVDGDLPLAPGGSALVREVG